MVAAELLRTAYNSRSTIGR
jgi:hypothetical protein